MRFLTLILFSVLTLSTAACAQDDFETLEIQRENGETLHFKVKIADEPQEWADGLMGIKSMPEDEGMLFLFNDLNHRAFWMKDTLIPLDMLFLAEDGRINQIYYEAQPLDEYRIETVYPAKAVLEINGGLAEKYGLTLKDKIKHPAFKELAQE